MLYSCTHMTTVGASGLQLYVIGTNLRNRYDRSHVAYTRGDYDTMHNRWIDETIALCIHPAQ